MLRIWSKFTPLDLKFLDFRFEIQILGHQSGISNAKTGCVTSSGMRCEKTRPTTIPVTIDAAPNIPATDAYSGSTDLEDWLSVF